ncbi:MAG: hypothetical protein KC620_04130, partial [Myxococcales bacterium]|nr:hypothetical protein [Myxococcales bacterium]
MNNMFFLPADPTDHVDAACAEAAARGAPVLLRVTAQRTANAAPGWPDDAPVFAWREAGLSLQAEGAVIDRRFIDFEEATSALADLQAQSVGDLRGPAPLAVFGAAFDAGRAPGAPWSDWPAGLLRVPARVRWSAGDGRVHEARHCLVAPGETPGAV